MRLVGGVQGETVRDALAHPEVLRTRVRERLVVRVDQDVDGGEATHARSFSKTVVQSFFMLTTVQPSSLARGSADSAPRV
ncbi:MAG: hypothetical protein QOK15_3597 [Nocardioidaceae bacterium]|nr:hypothetical protein [Nocardioidaceae bacterium]